MKKFFTVLLSFVFCATHAQQTDSIFIRKIADEILVNGQAYNNLRVLTKTIGNRLAGSPQMLKAEQWGFQLMQPVADTVYRQACKVPHWERSGKDIAYATTKTGKKILDVLALGNTVGTGAQGLDAAVVLVSSFDELEAKKDQVKGKIVFYNYAFDPRYVRTFESYRDAVVYRARGASAAAKYGAAAVMVRSMSHSADNYPHTGSGRYDTAYKKIPALAIGLKDADWLATACQSNSVQKIHLQTGGHFLPDADGHNIIGELKGTEHPDQYITVGGHLDSWDVGEGAHDDGAGITQTIEVLRALKALGYRPKHTIRFVLFANEENGARGGQAYAQAAAAKKEHHLFAVETDAGGFTPRGFSVDAKILEKVQSWKNLLEPYGGGDISAGGGGTDIAPLETLLGTPLGELLPDSQRYFDYHHTRNDVFENVNKRELELCAVNLAALIYLVDTYGL